MNGHFPEPYPDELLYSVLARLGSRVGQLSWQDYGGNIFGAKSATGIIELPNRMEVLSASLPNEFGITADRLIDENTMWPYYAAFLPAERRSRTREEMKGKGQPRVVFGLISLRGPKNDWLRYCPACVKDDRKTLGETYWHRSHQIPGGRVCVEHNLLLVDSSAALWHRSNRHAYIPAEDVIPRSLPDSIPGTAFSREVSADCVWLLTHPQLEIDPVGLKDRYASRLITSGLANHRGNIHMEDLHIRFVHDMGFENLKDLGIAIPDPHQQRQSWLASAIRIPSRSPVSIRHVLILRFLNIDIRTIHLPTEPARPFGNGPWPCLNQASNHCRLVTINSVDIAATNNGRSLRGLFSCPVCKMTYERLGPDVTESDQYRRDRIPIYGPVWEHKLEELWKDNTRSLRGISAQLGVDPHTVMRQIKRLGLHNMNSRPTAISWEAITFTKPAQGPRCNPYEYKAQWESLRSKNPNATTTELRKLAPAVYAFLRRHQLEWLRSHLSCEDPLPKAKSYFDWNARDREVAQLVRSAGQVLLDRVPLVRLTMKAILAQAGWPSLTIRNLRKMPQTQTVLNRFREDQFQFAVRRIKSCAKRLGEERQLSYQRLLSEANINWSLLQSQEVQNALIVATAA